MGEKRSGARVRKRRRRRRGRGSSEMAIFQRRPSEGDLPPLTVGGDVGGAAAVAVGGLRSLDVQCQVGLEVLSNHRVDGHQAEHAGLADAALRVVVALRRDTQAASGKRGRSLKRVQRTRKHLQGQGEEFTVSRYERCTRAEESRDDVRQQLQQGVLGVAFNDFGLHLDGRQVDGVVGRLHNGTQHLDALLRVDGAGQGGGRLFGRTHHLEKHHRG
ncbi:hypothetical protein EYF80_039731 [Liparis tanakae]|uniref:Uncharacterized protein n=1 Tax=Liparis tanakae TaxID=230148 RepID=A0A4Z2GAS2_9TELE|nr:hypothetical protein EYF80_039731 [Liparis tanakae]